MKKAIALLFALLLALGSALPLAGYLLARRLLGTAAPVSPASSQAQASSLETGQPRRGWPRPAARISRCCSGTRTAARISPSPCGIT